MAQKPIFKHVTSLNGISQSEVYSFLHDSHGFMWFGTLNGLNRFDGYEIITYNTNHENKYSISNNTIRAIAEDSLGRLWIGTDDGLNIYETNTQKFHRIRLPDAGGFQEVIFSIKPDMDLMWIGTRKGLYLAKMNSNIEEIESQLRKMSFSSPSFNSASINDILVSTSGNLWICSWGQTSSFVYQAKQEKLVEVETNSELNEIGGISLTEDLFGNIWIGNYENGIFRYNSKNKSITHFSIDYNNHSHTQNRISSLTADFEGNIWIGTQSQGIYKISFQDVLKDEILFDNFQFDHLNSESINSNLIYKLYVSKDNILWIGTEGAGINFYDPNQKQFETIKISPFYKRFLPQTDFIRSVYQDKYENLWLGTHKDGLFFFDGKIMKKIPGFEDQIIYKIYPWKEDKLWVCSNTGITLLSDKTNKIRKIDNDIYVHADIVKSESNLFWVATWKGLKRIIINSPENINITQYEFLKNNLDDSNYRVIIYNEFNNELWIGTEGNGLLIVKLDNNGFPISNYNYKNSNAQNSLSNNYIRSIYQQNDSIFWIGTYEGLNKVYRKSADSLKFEVFNKGNGLQSNLINSILEDSNRNLWIGANNGLIKFNTGDKSSLNYTVSDGLASNEFTEKSCFINGDGKMFFGSVNGITTFYPQNIGQSKLMPNTKITNFYFPGKESVNIDLKNYSKVKNIVLTDTLILKPNNNDFRFDFSAMIFSSPEKIKYKYILEGYNNNWIETDASNRFASFTNLSHGEYIFRVKSSNSDGIWEKNSRDIYIKIKTPFVHTWFAYIIYGIILLLTIVYFANYSVMRYATKKKIMLESEHNKRLHELDLLRTKFFINLSHDLRTPLTLISGPLEKIMQKNKIEPDTKYQLSIMQRNVKRLHYLIEQMLDIRKAEVGKLVVKIQILDIVEFIQNESSHFLLAIQNKGLLFNITSDEKVIPAHFDPDMISKIIFNLLSNAIKYTAKGEINIKISRKAESIDRSDNPSANNFIMVEVQDTGQGISQDVQAKIFERFYQIEAKSGKGYGIGLSHCKDLIEVHSGRIEVSSTPGIGSVFCFFIPDLEIKDALPQNEATRETSLEDIYVESIPNPENNLVRRNNPQSGKSILIIEDNADLRKYIWNELIPVYRIYEASDGVEGLEMANHYLPDLIVSDIMMPNMDGIEFCKRIKSNIKTSHIPVILLTARVDNETKYEGITEGADDYIPKPFEMEYLVIRIKNLLNSREKLRELFKSNISLEPSKITVTSVDEKFLTSLMKAIEKGIPEPDFNVNSLESEMGMSHANLYRKITSITGFSGKEILMHMRLKRAFQIITETKDMRISEVSFMVGFTNPKNFSRAFRKKFGKTPSDLIKEN